MEASSGPDSDGWLAGIHKESQSCMDHNVHEWVDSPSDAGSMPIPSKLILRWKYNKERKPVRQKSRVVVQGFHKFDPGANNSALVVHTDSVRAGHARAARDKMLIHQVDVRTASLQLRMKLDGPATCVIPPERLKCYE